MQNNIIQTEYNAPVVERWEKRQHLKMKRNIHNPHGLPLMSICPLVYIFQDIYIFQ